MFMPHLLAGDISETELVHTFVMLMFGGHDTTSHTLTTFLYRMGQNPEVFTKIKKEIKEKFGDTDFTTFESYKKLIPDF